jgi:uncharacterized membrane protein
MDKKATSIVAYLTIVGWLIAYLAGDQKGAKFHLNQGLVLGLASIIGSIVFRFIPILGWIISPLWSLAVFVFCILGILQAVNGEEKELPIVGGIHLLK